MKVIIVREFSPFLGGNLNMRQLLNPIFFSRDVKHPSKRQRSTNDGAVLIVRCRFPQATGIRE